jgi:hypothetical protein
MSAREFSVPLLLGRVCTKELESYRIFRSA